MPGTTRPATTRPSAADAALLAAALPARTTPDLHDVALALLAALMDAGGMDAQHAAPLVAAQVQRLSADFGGTALYIPKGLMAQITQRNRQIYAAFDGRNYLALSLRYGLTEVRVRRIIAAARAEDMAQRQGSLF